MAGKTAGILLIAFIVATPCRAFDGKRGGFVLGIGANLGALRFTEHERVGLRTWLPDRKTEFAPSLDVNLGAGFSDHLAATLGFRAWTFAHNFAVGDCAAIVNGHLGLEGLCFLSRRVPSLMLGAGVGFSFWSSPYVDCGYFGPGLYSGCGLPDGGVSGWLTLGYEFQPHVIAVINYDIMGTSRRVDIYDNDLPEPSGARVLGFGIRYYAY
jgi:hypothetical protein